MQEQGLFQVFERSDDEQPIVYMGNIVTTPIKGVEKVDLKFTSKHVVTLTNVLFVPKVRKDLVLGSLMNILDLNLYLGLISLNFSGVVCL